MLVSTLPRLNVPLETNTLRLEENFLTAVDSKRLLRELINTDHWNNGQYQVSGRVFSMPRVQTWYADPGVKYNFSYDLHSNRHWTPLLHDLKINIEATIGKRFNSVLINWYRNGLDWVDWHADNEIELGDNPTIASVSLGVSREFCYRHKSTKESGSIDLSNGSLLIMNPAFQKNWLHCIARDPNIQLPRINLTFRYVHMSKV